MSREMTNSEAISNLNHIYGFLSPNIQRSLDVAFKAMERPQGEFKKYKPLEPDYNVQCAVENLRTAYWSNEPEKVAKHFTEADEMIVSAICHYGYSVCKQPQGEWIAREDMDYLDENKVEHKHFECNKCGLIHDFIDGHTSQYNFCPNCGAKMKGGAE